MFKRINSKLFIAFLTVAVALTSAASIFDAKERTSLRRIAPGQKRELLSATESAEAIA